MTRRTVSLLVPLVGTVLLLQIPAARGQEGSKTKVSITVLVPQDNAALTIDGVATKKTGTSRAFTSPPLDTKGTYTYTFQVTWEPNNYTKITRMHKVKIDPSVNTSLTVDLTRDDPRWKDDIVVRYVPTPNDVVDAMCKLAGVGKDDVVYDLGCGDGRMVIRAVEKFGAKRGVGIELDPKLVKESTENARRARVDSRVAFRQGDVLKIDDIPDASVVLLYMGNDINLRLRPILQAKLKPGARVVSHRFTMGDWEPTTTQTVTVGGEDYLIHLWIIGGQKK